MSNIWVIIHFVRKLLSKHIWVGVWIPQGKPQFRGTSPSPLWSKGNIRRKPRLFGRWQQRCGLSLSVLQQLVLSQLSYFGWAATVTYNVQVSCWVCHSSDCFCYRPICYALHQWRIQKIVLWGGEGSMEAVPPVGCRDRAPGSWSINAFCVIVDPLKAFS